VSVMLFAFCSGSDTTWVLVYAGCSFRLSPSASTTNHRRPAVARERFLVRPPANADPHSVTLCNLRYLRQRVPEATWIAGTRRVLRTFVTRTNIYSNPQF
jgi:hypothetical protein